MADSYCYLLFLILTFCLSVHGARPNNEIMDMKSLTLASTCMTSTKVPHNEIMDMKSLTPASTCMTSTKVGRKLTEYGEGIHLPLKSGKDGNFLVTVGFGTPERPFTLLFDTGSDQTWIKCQQCDGTITDCNNNQAFFNPSLSSTFSKNLNCNPNCNPSVKYHDGTSITGYPVTDTLACIFSGKIPNFKFTCAENVTGTFEGASGLLGVGKGGNSLIAQTHTNSFCYCLPALEDSSGYIVFGVQAFETCKPDTRKFIPIEPVPDQSKLTAYYISLTGITIGGKRLEIASHRAMIDSGTVISRLPLSLYSVLRSAFQEIMSQYPSTSSPDPIFDTCYDLEGDIDDWRPPNIVLHLIGISDAPVDVALDSSAATMTGKSESEVCLAFAGNQNDNDLFIIGNQQHRARDLFFEINNNQIYFSSGECLGK